MSSSEPLRQRTTGRRVERRRRLEALDEESNKKRSNLDHTSNPVQGRRGPSDEAERKIQEAIDRRKEIFSQQKREYEATETIEGNYEYMDHTADIQLHSWGDSLEEALEHLAVALFGYMTQLSLININEEDSNSHEIFAEGHDLPSLVFDFLSEWLSLFHETQFLPRRVVVSSFSKNPRNDSNGFDFQIRSHGKGEVADWKRHAQGTEVKAITYSNLQVIDENGRWDVWVILDI